MPCSFSFAIGNPFFEKATGSLQGLEISNMNFGVQIHRTAILRFSFGRRRQAFMAFSSAFAMTIANSPESTGSVSENCSRVSNVIPASFACAK